MATGIYQYLMKIIKEKHIEIIKKSDQVQFHAQIISVPLPF